MPTPIADAVLIGVTALGLNAGDRVDLNASIYQINRPITFVQRFQAPAGNTNPINTLVTVTGDPSGKSDVRMQRQIISSEGSADFVDLRNRYAGTNHNGTGTVVRSYTDHLYTSVTGGGHLDVGRVNYSHWVVSNGSTVNDATVFEAGDLILSNGGRVGTSHGFRVDNIGHAQNVDIAYGLRVANFAAAKYAVGVEVNTMAGPNAWAVRSNGTAPNALNGRTRIGSTAPPQYALDVSGDAQVTGVYRFANGVIIGSGPGMPPYPAMKGSLYISTDFGMVVNTDGNMGWVRK